MFLLDTNVISELRRQRPHGAVLAWLGNAPESGLFVSAVTIGELQAGVEIVRDQDAGKAWEIETWISQINGSFQILDLDAESFRCWGRLMHRRSRDLTLDALIAATAITRGLTVVTRNVRDFDLFGVATLNPFEVPAS